MNHLSKWIRYSVLAIGFSGAVFWGSELMIGDAEASGGWTGRCGTIKSTIWGPIEGARIYSSMAGGTEGPASVSGEKGGFVTGWYMPPCPCFSFKYRNIITAEMRYLHFNPKQDCLGSYYKRLLVEDHCMGFDECPWSPTLVSMVNKLLLTEIQSAIAVSAQPSVGFLINVAYLTGMAGMAGVIPGDSTEYSLDDALPMTISESDLKDTDVYVYRISNDDRNDERIASKEGVSQIKSEGAESLVEYRMLMRGPLDCSPGISVDLYHGIADVDESTLGSKAGHLYSDDKVKVILVNRATGYIGSAIADVEEDRPKDLDGNIADDLGFISFSPGPILMRPPNLKIKAERRYVVDSGLTAAEKRNYIIGFEGSGLTSDEVIVITTDWVDADGTPLPHDLPGYTGRLAKVVGRNQLGQISNFDIKPGLHTQVIQLPREELDTAHYYIHVSPQPAEGNPDFSTIGAGTGPLQYRPRRYVPIQVPLVGGVGVRQWVYGPELQFSLFDLKKMSQVDTKGREHNLLDRETAPIFDKLDFIYTLLEDDLPVLPQFGAPRQLVFSIGEEEITALTVGQDHPLKFQNIDNHLVSFEAEDFSTLRLYQNSDSDNVLWEYAFGEVELLSVEGTHENGALKVRGRITPEVTVESHKILLNGKDYITGGSFTAGDFFFIMDQNNLSAGSNTVKLELIISGVEYSASFIANLENNFVTGSDNYFEVYTLGGPGPGGAAACSFPMQLTERYSTVTYSLPQRGRTASINKSELLLSNIPGPAPWGDKIVLVSAMHVYIMDNGSVFLQTSFSPPQEPYCVNPNSFYCEVVSKKWVTTEDYESIRYGIADVCIGFTTAAGINLPIPWPSPLVDNDVEAPDQLGM
jgi:hypothetical protein